MTPLILFGIFTFVMLAAMVYAAVNPEDDP